MAFGSLFGRGRRSPQEVVAAAPPPPDFTRSGTDANALEERLIKDLDNLAVKVRAAGADISPVVYSKLRVIDDVLRSLLHYIKNQGGCSTEQEYFLNALITSYIPDALNAYLKLDPKDKADGGEASMLLMKQYDTLEDKARDLANMVRTGAVAELSTQAFFIESKFGS